MLLVINNTESVEFSGTYLKELYGVKLGSLCSIIVLFVVISVKRAHADVLPELGFKLRNLVQASRVSVQIIL